MPRRWKPELDGDATRRLKCAYVSGNPRKELIDATRAVRRFSQNCSKCSGTSVPSSNVTSCASSRATG